MAANKVTNYFALISSVKIFERLYSALPSGPAASAEQKMEDILRKKFPLAKSIEVVDVSGGCGAMYEISVVTPEFKGLSIVKQHRLINETLKEEIKGMHGLRIYTSVPQ